MKQRLLAAYFALTFGITWGIALLLFAFPAQFRAWFGELSLTNPLFLLAVWSTWFKTSTRRPGLYGQPCWPPRQPL